MRIETWLPQYLPLLQQAAARYHLDWRLLAGIAMTESSGDPSAIGPLLGDGQRAEGLMQFLPSTFYGTAGADASPQQVAAAGGYGVDGDHDGQVTPLDAADAIFSAAHYLAALGAHQDLTTALQRYSGGAGSAYLHRVEGYMQAAGVTATARLGRENPQAVASAPNQAAGGNWRSSVPTVWENSFVSFWAPLVGIQRLSLPNPASFSAQA